jgi:hypothetical protein
VGDCYIVAGGLMKRDATGFRCVDADGEPRQHHARSVAFFAMDLLAAARGTVMPHNGLPVVMRVGIHTGAVASGIVGERMPRFCLFGDTMNVASRMETNCPPGNIHISAETNKLLAGVVREKGGVVGGGVGVGREMLGVVGGVVVEGGEKIEEDGRIQTIPMGGVQVKGKGMMETYLIVLQTFLGAGEVIMD